MTASWGCSTAFPSSAPWSSLCTSFSQMQSPLGYNSKTASSSRVASPAVLSRIDSIIHPHTAGPHFSQTERFPREEIPRGLMFPLAEERQDTLAFYWADDALSLYFRSAEHPTILSGGRRTVPVSGQPYCLCISRSAFLHRYLVSFLSPRVPTRISLTPGTSCSTCTARSKTDIGSKTKRETVL